MFNLGEKKAFMTDLVTRVVGEGTRSWNRTLEPELCLAQELLRLEDLALFKMKDFRLLFVAKCLQLHHQSGATHTILSRNSFDLITDMYRVILREGNNDGDFLAVRLVYQAAALFGIYVGDHIKTVLNVLRKHEAWRNRELWSVTLNDVVARDKQRWMNLQGTLQYVLSIEFPAEQLITLMLFFRLRSLVRSMLALPTPSATIEEVVSRACEGHNVTFTMEELSVPLAPGLAMWVLQLVALASALPAPKEGGGRGGEDGRTSKAQSGTASQMVIRWASETALEAGHGSCLGYSACQELLRYALERLASTPSSQWTQFWDAPPQHDKAASPSGVRMCLCGVPYRPWTVLGGYGVFGVKGLSSLVCETCFRSVAGQQALSLEASTVMQGTLLGGAVRVPVQCPSVPQAVGCASLPSAPPCAPASLSAFWALPVACVSEEASAKHQPPHRRKSSRERVAKSRERASQERLLQSQSSWASSADDSTSASLSTSSNTGGATGAGTEEGEGATRAEGEEKEKGKGLAAERRQLSGGSGSVTMKAGHVRSKSSLALKEFRSILHVGVEVLKHGRMGRPHLRTVFLDPVTSLIIWCNKEDAGSVATIRATARGGVPLASLREVKAAPDRRKLVLVFKERTLTVEATSAEQYEFLFNGFSLACTSNGGHTETRPVSMRNLGSTKKV